MDNKSGKSFYNRIQKYFVIICLLGLFLNLMTEVYPDISFFNYLAAVCNIVVLLLSIPVMYLWYYYDIFKMK